MKGNSADINPPPVQKGQISGGGWQAVAHRFGSLLFPWEQYIFWFHGAFLGESDNLMLTFHSKGIDPLACTCKR